MRDRFAQLQLDGFIGQQAQAPARVPFGRSGTGERRDLGALRAVNPDGSPGARPVKERSLEPFAQITRLTLKMVWSETCKTAEIACGCWPRCSKSRIRARVCVLALVVPRLMMVVKERSSFFGSLMGRAVLVMLKRYDK